MTTSAHKRAPGPRLSARAVDVHAGETTLEVSLEDGRIVIVPLAWFPRLEAASLDQRRRWTLVGDGVGIHWPDVDEDISVENLLMPVGDVLRDRTSDHSSATG